MKLKSPIIKNSQLKLSIEHQVVEKLARPLTNRGWYSSAFIFWMLAEKINKRSNALRRYVDWLLVRNKLEIVTELLVRIGDSGSKHKSYAQRKMYRIAIWYARSGHLRYGESLLKRLSDTKGAQKFGRNALVLYWNKFAMFTPFVADSIKAALVGGLRVSGAQAAMHALWLMGRLDDRVIDLFASYLGPSLEGANYNSGYVKDFIAVCSSMERFDIIEKLRLDYPDKLHFISYFLSFPENYGMADAHMIEGREAIELGTKKIDDILTNTELSVAIVGNSPCEVGQGKGSEIDSYDYVVRFNRFSTDKLSQDYGSKVDCVVVTKGILHKIGYSFPSGLDLIITGEDPWVFQPDGSHLLRMINSFRNISLVNVDIYRELVDALNAAPSSGLQIITHVLRKRASLKNVGLYGFSFDDQVGHSARSSNYSRQSKPSFRHNWKGEALFFRALTSHEQVPDDFSDYRSMRFDNALGSLHSFRPTRFKLVGDHSKYHCGSAAVVRYLKRYLKKQGVLVKDASYDFLIVNGEGSMHHDSKDCVSKIKALRVAQEKGKRTALINTVWQGNSHLYDEVIQKLDFVMAREVASRDAFYDHGVNAIVGLDISYFETVKPEKVTDYEKKRVVTDFYSKEFSTFVIWNGGKESKLPYVNMKTMSWSDLVGSLKSASMLITGRHHAVYAACKAEIPFIAFGGNTHKIEGLIESSGIPIPMCNDRKDLPELIEWVNNNREVYEELFRWMQEQPPFTLPFELL